MLVEPDTDVSNCKLRARKAHGSPSSLELRGWPRAEGKMGIQEGRKRRGGIACGSIYLTRTLRVHENGCTRPRTARHGASRKIKQNELSVTHLRMERPRDRSSDGCCEDDHAQQTGHFTTACTLWRDRNARKSDNHRRGKGGV